jgi:hypothetical protein
MKTSYVLGKEKAAPEEPLRQKINIFQGYQVERGKCAPWSATIFAVEAMTYEIYALPRLLTEIGKRAQKRTGIRARERQGGWGGEMAARGDDGPAIRRTSWSLGGEPEWALHRSPYGE